MIRFSLRRACPGTMAEAPLGFEGGTFRGRMGDLVYKRYQDKTVVTRVPQFKGWSKKQKERRNGFAAASTHAARVQRDPGLRASYALWAKKAGLTIRSTAISDFLRAPVLRMVNVRHYSGDRSGWISILVAQKYKLVAAKVIIRDPAGQVIEEGPARCLGPDQWSYTGTQDLRGRGLVLIEGIGIDRLGRTVSLVVEKVL
jgi:hypothetical protein